MDELGRERDAKLIEAGLQLSSELALDVVLQRIVELAAEVTGARYAALGVVDPEGGLADFVTTGITDTEREAIGAPPHGRGILGVLLEEGRPLRLADIREHPRSTGFPPNHPPMRSFLGAPVVARGQVFGNIYLTDKQGADEFTEDDERAVAVLAAQAGVAVENARLYEETKRRERWLDASSEIATSILAGAGSDEALELVASRARELVGAHVATIATPVGDGSLMLAVAEGGHAEELRGVTFPLEESLSGEVIRTGKAVILSDASADERAHQPLVHLGRIGPVVFLPLSARGEAFGTLAVGNEIGGRAFGTEDLHLLETFADQAAVALEYASAQRDLRRLAVLEDRERIAKELHDGVIQSLFAVGMGLEAAQATSADPEIAERIDGAAGDIDRVIRDLRNYIFGLRPGILADRQLDQALRELGEEFQSKSGVVTIVDVDGRVAAELASQASDVLQITREALSNIGRHSEADTCRVSLVFDGDGAVLEIDDDGHGFDVEASVGTGDGLANLKARAVALGGQASIESSLQNGTTIHIAIPL